MQQITIRNFGPIQEISIPIKKYNLFIGSSGAGKSTLSKVICNAQWLEKELVVSRGKRPNQKESDWYVKQLAQYHGLKNYIHPDSYIEYQGESLSFVYDGTKGEASFTYEIKRNLDDFRRKKTLYIPAERSVVSVIPNWFEIKLPQNNLRGFLSSWEEARKSFTREQPLPLALFNADYFTTDSGALDIISFHDGKEMLFGEVASGLQASVPLSVLIRYYGSPNRLMSHTSILNQLDHDDLFTFLKLSKPHLETGVNDDNWEVYEFQHLNLITLRGTSFFIEEPELNLFPELQYQLFSEVVRVINQYEDNALTLTTHSPYVLAFMSNYIYAHHLLHKMDVDVNDVVPEELMINGEDVAAYLLEKGGAVNLLTDPTLGIEIKDLDKVSEEINKVWENLLDREMGK